MGALGAAAGAYGGLKLAAAAKAAGGWVPFTKMLSSALTGDEASSAVTKAGVKNMGIAAAQDPSLKRRIQAAQQRIAARK